MRDATEPRPSICERNRFICDLEGTIPIIPVTDTLPDARILPGGKQLAPGGTRTPTYKARWSLGERLDRYEVDLRERGLSDRTVEGVLWALKNMFMALWENGFDVNPRRVGRAEIDYLRDTHYAGRAQSYIHHNLSIMKMFLKWAGNKQIEAIRWPIRTWVRSNADWLEDDAARLVRIDAEGIERILVHCELDLGMRRIEVLRLRVADFQRGRRNVIHVLGKGRNGGKPRDICWHPDTPAELEGYLRLRDAVIAKAKVKNPDVVVPDSLLVYECAGQVRAYRKSAMDNVINKLSMRMGMSFTHHTLRRTCGRMMYRSDVRIEQIAAFLGHSDPKTTMLYLGLDLDDMDGAMQQYAQYQKAAKIPGNGISGSSQQNGGPCGIRDHQDDWLIVENSNPRNCTPGRLIEK